MDAIFAKGIYEEILIISSEELQNEMWLNADSKLVSSYAEVMCSLYDDNLFEEFVNYGCIKLSFNESLIKNLRKLNILLKLFKNTGYQHKFDENIINDKNWLSIIKVAKKIIKNWLNKFRNDYLLSFYNGN